MQKFLEKNRWVVLVASVLVWSCTNFPSLWAVFQADAAAAYGITLEESAMLFPMCTVFFGISSIIGGRLQDKFPPNIVSAIGGVIMASGVIMLSVFGEGTSVMKLYLCFCLPFGGGCGFIFPAVSASIMKWYADKKGFAMGLSLALASGILVFLTYISKYLLNTWGSQKTFFVYGVVFMIVTVSCTLILVNPTREYIQEKLVISNAASNNSAAQEAKIVDFTSVEMLKTKQFYLLFIAAIFSVPAYMLIAPSIVTLGIQRGLSESLAVSSVAVATGVSAVGKFIIPAISDKIGRKKSAIIFTMLATFFSVLLMKATGISLLVIYSALVFAHSGWTTLISPFVTDLFGTANAGANMGIISLYSTIASLGSSLVLAMLAPILGASAAHIIGIVGIAISVVLVTMIDTNTAKLKEAE